MPSPTADLEQSALKLLARREHSQRELINKLKKKAFTLDQIKSLLESLKEEGLQSDQRFAEAFTKERIRMGYGPRVISMALQERGVTEALIDDSISVYSDVFWEEQLEALWRRRFGNKPYDKDLAEKARQYRFLSYRGFDSHQIYTLLKRFFHED